MDKKQKAKLLRVCYKRIVREFNKELVEKRGMPYLWLLGYKNAVFDILFDFNKDLWQEFCTKYGYKLHKTELKLFKKK